MKRISVALVEPTYEVNAGQVARVMKNFGVDELIFINPKLDLSHARKFASHGVDVLYRTKNMDFEELIRSFDVIVGTTAITCSKSSNILRKALTPKGLAENLESIIGKVCLLLGRESTGLKNEELRLCDLVVSIRTGTDYKTLNISHSLAILLYELSKNEISVPEDIASKKDKERAISYSIELAKMCGFTKHKIPLLEEAMRRLFGKGKPTPREVYLIMGLLREAKIALLRPKS
ncbi:MAG: hypothetical protein L6N96_00445 [Candidatus Methylarchaceae archaeon HK02M2]|nr:hypothetical protein [Candidatus Methylarchaceae archaeon HK02M2]